MLNEFVDTNILSQNSVFDKIRDAGVACDRALRSPLNYQIPETPGRDLAVVSIAEARLKIGLSKAEGQAKLLHDLASIELQATELAFRTLVEFPTAPEDFREELSRVVYEESRHLQMCVEGIEKLGFKWGDWPVHIGLWQAVSHEDSILDRLVIVHRYLEGSGLDAGVTLLTRLNGIANLHLLRVVQTIVKEEVDHVQFGSIWYRRICENEGLDWREDFGPRLTSLMYRIPRRLEKVRRPIRLEAGFTNRELDFLETLNDSRPWEHAGREKTNK